MIAEIDDSDQLSNSNSDGHKSNSFDVVVVGGGPAGAAVGVFTARYGLDTLIFDRGNSSLQRCAFLENFLGFPAGIDIETFYALMHDHAMEMGCAVRSSLVETVERADSGGFRVTTQGGDTVDTVRVVAATRYGGEYLHELDEANEMFETHRKGGDKRELFDRDYPDHDGRTPTDGLYIASPTASVELQALSSAGHGARVARAVVEDVRRERGFPEGLSGYRDWIRREGHSPNTESLRDKLRVKIDRDVPDDTDLSAESLAELREREIDRRLDRYLSADEIQRRTERSHDRLLEHIDDDRILAAAREIRAQRRSN
ncbi:thioredoxin reductase [Haloarcula mannanilytica]|uniref:Thioredoxin reductase n=1 Tax=Haloarcula mannanilytica TaxID=2509225 RepID=A0A4C2EPL6_9EURY|nr:FAD-dependent oxidoreductase [Haloarcula mannanilytica]GCF16212.1 thioredoxin reductase [Haloarcula mannanilytica]